MLCILSVYYEKPACARWNRSRRICKYVSFAPSGGYLSWPDTACERYLLAELTTQVSAAARSRFTRCAGPYTGCQKKHLARAGVAEDGRAGVERGSCGIDIVHEQHGRESFEAGSG